MNQTILAAIAPLVVVAIAFTIGAFAAHRERAERAARIAAQESRRSTAAVA
jgi:cytochrome c-type biogenesis protein CcmH/NrfF